MVLLSRRSVLLLMVLASSGLLLGVLVAGAAEALVRCCTFSSRDIMRSVMWSALGGCEAVRCMGGCWVVEMPSTARSSSSLRLCVSGGDDITTVLQQQDKTSTTIPELSLPLLQALLLGKCMLGLDFQLVQQGSAPLRHLGCTVLEAFVFFEDRVVAIDECSKLMLHILQLLLIGNNMLPESQHHGAQLSWVSGQHVFFWDIHCGERQGGVVHVDRLQHRWAAERWCRRKIRGIPST